MSDLALVNRGSSIGMGIGLCIMATGAWLAIGKAGAILVLGFGVFALCYMSQLAIMIAYTILSQQRPK